MVTIEREGTGYVMKFSAPGTGLRSYKVLAHDATEIARAILHHYGDQHGSPKCPFCRLMEAEREAASKVEARKRDKQCNTKTR